MHNDPYNYPVTVGVKVIIKKDEHILLTKEPQSHSWMPGRLGLPGGKLFLNESISSGLKRKIKDETGLSVKGAGLFKVVGILMPEKTVYHLIFLADYLAESKNKKLYSGGLEWVSEDKVKKLGKDDFTEFYLDEVLSEYFSSPNAVPLDIFIEQESFKDERIKEWMAKDTIRE